MLDAIAGAVEPEVALAAVRGTPFAEVADEPWAQPLVELSRERIALVEDLHAVALAERGVAEVIGKVRRYALERPERELRWEQLIRVLAQIGRRVEALSAAREARAALAAFGLTPGAGLLATEMSVIAEHAVDEPAALLGRDELLAKVLDALPPAECVVLVGLGWSDAHQQRPDVPAASVGVSGRRAPGREVDIARAVRLASHA